jgi:hypothetical protein
MCPRSWPICETGDYYRLLAIALEVTTEPDDEDRRTVNVGDRVELIRTADPYTRLQPGARGTVEDVDELGTIHVAWQDGSTLGLVPGVDLMTIQAAMGHGALATTGRYLHARPASEQAEVFTRGVRVHVGGIHEPCRRAPAPKAPIGVGRARDATHGGTHHQVLLACCGGASRTDSQRQPRST